MLLDAITRGRLYQVKFLLESGSVNVNVTDHYGQTPLMKAIQLDDKMHHTRYKIVRLLLDHGAKVNLADKAGRTALMLAVIHGHKAIAEKILKCSLMDLDLNAGDYEGNTALIHAALVGHDIITSLLITSLKRFGLGVDKTNHRGFTAMIEAVRHGHERCAKVLYVEGGASLTIRDPENFMNAEEWAVKNELFNLAELIEKNRLESAAVKSSNHSQNTSNVEKTETTNLEIQMNEVEVSSRPQSPRDVIKRPQSPRDVIKRPQSPRDVIKRPVSSRKQGNKTVLTVPRIMHNLQNQEEQLSAEMDNSRNPSPRDFIQENDNHSVSPENEGKAASRVGSCAQSSLLLTKRRSSRPRVGSAGSLERSVNAKTEVQRLLCLYGVQNSITYRKGYDPNSLPPSGMWPDPNAVIISDSIENINTLGEMDFFGESSFGVGRRSGLSSTCSRRMSIVGGNAREGRRMSIISQGNPTSDRRVSVMGRKFNVGQLPPKNMLDAFAGRKQERRMSMAPRPSLGEKPMLRRMNTSTSPLVG